MEQSLSEAPVCIMKEKVLSFNNHTQKLTTLTSCGDYLYNNACVVLLIFGHVMGHCAFGKTPDSNCAHIVV